MAGKETTGFRMAFRPTRHTKISDLLKAYPDMIERPCVVKYPGFSRDILRGSGGAGGRRGPRLL